MNTLKVMIKRNVKIFFHDKGLFFTSLITPLILLVLYATFLGNVYRDSFQSGLPAGVNCPSKLIEGCVGGQLISSLLAVSCVTVTFCSNMLMVQDKANGAITDIKISPVNGSKLALGYYLSTLMSSLIICFTATAVCLAYVAFIGWYMTACDVLLLILDVFLLVMFGTALSSVINFFLSTQGQISAVGSMVSSLYGFISGAYMPISQFSAGLQKMISFLPGTYGTSLLRSHAMRGAFAEMVREGFPEKVVEDIKDSIDCNFYFFGTKVNDMTKAVILVVSIVVLLGVYVLINRARIKKK